MTFRRISILACTAGAAIVGAWTWCGMTGYCEISEFHVWQGVGGSVDVVDTPGYYANNFGKAWDYPKTMQKSYSGAEAIRVTFNDNGKGTVSSFVQLSLPTDREKRLKLQEKFSGNKENITQAVLAHLTNCLKNSGPLMSATEHQASRKAEFTQVIEDQLKNGLFQMRRTRVELKDRVDENGKPIWVEANEVVLDSKGVSARQGPSPLQEYGLVVNQFSVTETEYDELSAAQFKAKQEAFLAAERSKAQREQEIAQKLMVVAKGEREAAEETSKGNVIKAQKEVEGQTKVAVAHQAKLEAETLAEQKKAVALLEKQAAETKASQEAEVARIAAEQQKLVVTTAAEASKTKLVTEANAAKEAAALQSEADKLKAMGMIAIAEAKQKEIQIAGAVREQDKVLATIAADRDVHVAAELAKIAVPGSIFIGGQGAGTGGTSAVDPMLLNINLLRSSGLFDFTKVVPQPAPAAK